MRYAGWASPAAVPSPKSNVSTTDVGRGRARAELWLLPNPSGLNAHHTVESLAD